VVQVAREVTGRSIPVRVIGRRAGDPAVVVFSSLRAISDLGWKPEFADLRTIIETAWRWHQGHPDGYRD